MPNNEANWANVIAMRYHMSFMRSPLDLFRCSASAKVEFPRILVPETVWKIARKHLNCGHQWGTVPNVTLLGLMLPTCRAPLRRLSEFPDSLSTHSSGE